MLVIEGFLIFYDAELARMRNSGLWRELGNCTTACTRRLQRDHDGDDIVIPMALFTTPRLIVIILDGPRCHS